jgi:hypothetical protein
MRVLLWIAGVLAVLWGGYWFVGSTAVERGTAQWFEDQAALGLTAEREDISVSGFPSRFDLTVTKPHFADPATGWGWRAPFAQVLSMTWKPWHVIAALPNDQLIEGPGEAIALTSSRMMASLRLSPTTDLPLQEVVIEGHDVLAKSDLGWTVGTKSLVLALGPDAADPLAQRLGLRITDLTPDPAFAALVPDLGDRISTVQLDATLTLSAALDRHMAETQPRLTAVTLTNLRAEWGALKLTAKGQVDRGPDGFAVGQIDFRVENWRNIPALIVALGLVRPEMGATITRGVETLARAGGNPDVLDLPLIFADGRMVLGPLPLGAAPRMD